jgi:hypothetical protein
MRILLCDICGSQKLAGKTCGSCRDMTDEQWAIHDARDDFARGAITIAELERRIETALTESPRRSHCHLVYR